MSVSQAGPDHQLQRPSEGHQRVFFLSNDKEKPKRPTKYSRYRISKREMKQPMRTPGNQIASPKGKNVIQTSARFTLLDISHRRFSSLLYFFFLFLLQTGHHGQSIRVSAWC